MNWSLIGVLSTCLFMACTSPASTPTVVPTPTLAATPVPTLDAQVTDLQYAFLSRLNDLTSDVEALATEECAQLVAETGANPTEIGEVRGLAATVQRVGTTKAELDGDDVRSALADLNRAVTQLDSALNTCGIAQ